MSSNPLGMTQVAEAEVIKAVDIAAAKEKGYDINDMLAKGEDVTKILREVRK
jgi:hypothetical protein